MVYKHKKCPKSLKSELLFVQFTDTKYVLGHSNYLDLGCVIKYLVPEIQKKCLDFRHMSENQTVFYLKFIPAGLQTLSILTTWERALLQNNLVSLGESFDLIQTKSFNIFDSTVIRHYILNFLGESCKIICFDLFGLVLWFELPLFELFRLFFKQKSKIWFGPESILKSPVRPSLQHSKCRIDLCFTLNLSRGPWTGPCPGVEAPECPSTKLNSEMGYIVAVTSPGIEPCRPLLLATDARRAVKTNPPLSSMLSEMSSVLKINKKLSLVLGSIL